MWDTVVSTWKKQVVADDMTWIFQFYHIFVRPHFLVVPEFCRDVMLLAAPDRRTVPLSALVY